MSNDDLTALFSHALQPRRSHFVPSDEPPTLRQPRRSWVEPIELLGVLDGSVEIDELCLCGLVGEELADEQDVVEGW